MRPSLRTCKICGKEFEGIGTAKYCSRKCKNKAISKQKHENYLAHKALALGKTLEQVKAEDAGNTGSEDPKRGLDAKLGELREKGQTYAQAQKADSIEKFARIEVPEAFVTNVVETPEQTARRRKVFLSKEERDVLIRIEAQVETLQAYFKTDSEDLDYPGVVLGRILEQVKGLLEADE